MKLLLILLSGLLFTATSHAQPVKEIMASSVITSSENFSDHYEVKGRWGVEPVYAWVAATSKQKQTRLTQSMSNTHTYSAGIGSKYQLNSGVQLFAEWGMGYFSHQGRPTVEKEVIYHIFKPTFGVPPFQADGNFYALETDYQLKPSAQATIGVQWPIGTWSVEASYTAQSVRETFKIWNPTFNGGPVQPLSQCGCLWLGKNTLNRDHFKIGIIKYLGK
jgi:hypothetical protein